MSAIGKARKLTAISDRRRTAHLESLENRQLLAGDLYAGDANQDYHFDESDFIQVFKAGKFETALPSDWTEGDWNGAPGGTQGDPPVGDGEFNSSDFVIAFEQGLFKQGPYDVAAGEPVHQRQPLSESPDTPVTLSYDVETGNLELNIDDEIRVTNFQLHSKIGRFSGSKPREFVGLFDVFDANSMYKLDPAGVNGTIELGTVLPPGLSGRELFADLTFDGALFPGGGVGPVGLICECLLRQQVAPRASGAGIVETSFGDLTADNPAQTFEFETLPSDRVSVALKTDGSLNATVTILSNDQAEIATATTNGDSNVILLENVPLETANSIFIQVSANGDQFGAFEMETAFNATFEKEPTFSTLNDTFDTAESLAETFVAAPHEMQTSTILASLALAPNAEYETAEQETFESGLLSEAWTTNSSQPEGSVIVTDAFGAGEGRFSLLMDGTLPAAADDGERIVSFIYEPATGSFTFDVSEGDLTTTIEVESASGIFSGEEPPADVFTNLFDVQNDTKLFKLDPAGFGDIHLPNIAQRGLTLEFLESDLRIAGAWVGGGPLTHEIIVTPFDEIWNEAIWTVDASQIVNRGLSFQHAEWNDEETAIPTRTQRSVFGDGISISDDGQTWYQAWIPEDQPVGEWQQYFVDLEAVAADTGISLDGEIQIKFQQSGKERIPNGGRGFDDIQLLTLTDQDWYSLTPDVGEVVSFVAAPHDTNKPVSIDIHSADGTQLISGIGAQNANSVVNNFVSDGQPIGISVKGGLQDYTLFTIRNGQFETETNNRVDHSTPISITGNVIGHHADPDFYGFVSAGAQIEVVDANGQVVEHTLVPGQLEGTRTGLRAIQIAAGGADDGRYFMHVEDAAQDQFAFVIQPGEGGRTADTATIVVDSLYPLRSTTINADALQIDGVAATSATILNDHEILFEFDEVAEGDHTATLAAGVLTDGSGRTNIAAEITYHVDATPPEVASISISDNETLAAGITTIEVAFSESVLVSGSNQLLMSGSRGTVEAQNFNFDPATLTLTVDYDLSIEDEYAWTISNAGPDFVDLAGIAMAEPFTVSFSTDIAQREIVDTFKPILPLGTAAYQGEEFSGVISTDDTDEFTLQVDGKQVITAAIQGDFALAPEVSIVAANGDVLATSNSDSNRASVSAFAADAGTYSIRITGKAGTVGIYSGNVYLNAILESEQINNDASTAEPLGHVAADFGLGDVHQVTLLGTLDIATPGLLRTEDFESGVLPDGWTTESSDEEARVQVSNEFGSAAGEFALVMDSAPVALAARRAAVQLIYDPATGEVAADSPFPLTTLEIQSASGIFTGDPAQNLESQFQVDTDIKIFKLAPTGFDDVNFGNVAQTGLSYEFLANDLSIAGSWILGGRPDFDIVVVEEGVRSEAVWSADLTGVINPKLRFEHTAWNDSSTHLPIGFQGSVQGDGVSISIDGETWYRAFTPAGESEPGNWSNESINLQAIADFAEISIDGPVQIKFQHYGNGVLPAQGRGYDQIEILGDTVDQDWYSIDLSDGESFSLAAQNGSDDPIILSVYDAAGDLLIESTSESQATIQNIEDATMDNDSETYSVRVRNTAGSQSDYHLIATRNAGIDVSLPIADPDPEFGQGIFFVYDTASGQIDLNTTVQLTTLELRSRDGTFTGNKQDHPGGAEPSHFVGLFDRYDSEIVFKLNPSGFGNLQNFASVQPGLSLEQFVSDVSINGSILGGGGLLNNPLVQVVAPPEIDAAPSSGVRDLTVFRSYVGHLRQDDIGSYVIDMPAGSNVAIETATLADGALPFANQLDVSIRVLDSIGNVLATDDNSAPDGKNAFLNFAADDAGVYTIEVVSSDTSGEYVISATGDFESPAFQAISSSIADGGSSNEQPTTFDVQFNRNIDADSVQPSDLTLNGVPATSVQINSADQLSFVLPANVADGDQQIKIAAGAITDLIGRDSEDFTVSFFIDTTDPTIVAVSIEDDAAIDAGPFQVDIQFNEPIDLTLLNDDSIGLDSFNGRIAPTSRSFDINTNTLSLDFGELSEGRYVLEISQDVYDLAGNQIDSRFARTFVALAGIEPYDGGFQPVTPHESFAFQSELIEKTFAFDGDLDEITFALDAGQLINITARDPNGSHRATLIGPDGQQIRATESRFGLSEITVIGRDAGTYRLSLESTGGFTRNYEARIGLNLISETEASLGLGNNQANSAQPLNNFFRGEAVEHVSIVGKVKQGADWFSIDSREGDTFSIGLKSADPTISISLLDDLQNIVAEGLKVSNFDFAIREYRDKTIDGLPSTFYIVVESQARATDDYLLSVSRDTTLEIPNSVTPLGPSLKAIGSIATDQGPDEYSFFADSGDDIELILNIPYQRAGVPGYSLVGELQLLDPTGQEVATGDLQLSHTATTSGIYRAQVVASSGAGGYSISASGNSVRPSDVEILSVSPESGALLFGLPGQVTVEFSHLVDPLTVEPSDLLIGAVPASSVKQISLRTYQFSVDVASDTGNGEFELRINDGAVANLAGVQNVEFTSRFNIDRSSADFDADGDVDSDDLNSFCSSLSQHGLAYDINADGVYDTTDYVEILSSSFGTLPGDIDLNGVFDSTDLVSLFQVGNYETGASGLRWTDGDFNCDGQVNSTDIVDAFIAGLYEVPAAENETEVETVILEESERVIRNAIVGREERFQAQNRIKEPRFEADGVRANKFLAARNNELLPPPFELVRQVDDALLQLDHDGWDTDFMEGEI